MDIKIPQGFHITAAERGLVERVHEEVAPHTRYTPRNFADVENIANKLKKLREDVIANGKCAEEEGEQYKADECRHDLEEIDYALDCIRRRWRDCGGALVKRERADV